MKTVEISRSEIQGHFATPAAGQGQIVETSYAVTDDYAIERIEDRSDRSVTMVAYRWDGRRRSDGTPRLGRRVGNVSLV